MRSRLIKSFVCAAVAATSLAVCAADDNNAMPDSMVWTAYNVGSAGYANASAIADAFGRKYGTRIRIQPSSTAIGRLQPLVSERANLGFLSTGTFFATEGIVDFSEKRWGPQDLRVVAGKVAAFGMPTAADAHIDTIADVAGKRLAYVAGNPSVNVKCDAVLAFAGLDRSDVKIVMFPTYTAAMSALKQDKADATCTLTTPSLMYELAESPRGIHWPQMPASDTAAWARVQKMAPYASPYTETVGAGVSADHPVELMGYRYPQIVVRADESEDYVYQVIKGLDETFDIYRNVTAAMPRWALDKSGHAPMGAPFHPGAIRYLREKGIWNADDQAWQDKRLRRLNALREAWQQTMDTHGDEPDDAFAQAWQAKRRQVIDSL
ncbi:TAXI family TRAP transporter solute-binding subunit [Salinisphaera sp. T31B1]|uniref:TAXI family TRAP transporter solute-binding subunit n=1 Tax=Salinisphaera sp. T31B1 TaxID=727963 RepID=UPI0033418A69